MFIINALKKLRNSKRTFFTTPAHLESSIIPAGVKKLIGYKAFRSDFSEVDGLDNLKKPKNCILKSQQKLIGIYNTKQSFYLTQGSTIGILATMLTILKNNDKVLIARNAHESVFNGLVLTGAIPVWFLPEYNEEFDVAKGITLKQIEQEYNKNPDIKAIIITSPNYEGMVSEIKEISDFCQKHHIFFIVDEAHGALFSFSEKLPKRGVDLGADISVQSLHKTTPALNGTALLHIGKNSKINPDDIQKNLNLITTTSPSWLLIASAEGAVEFLNSKRCENEINELIKNINNLKNKHKNFDFLDNDDPTKILFKKEQYTGEFLSGFLSKNNIEDELVTQRAVLCLCGIGTSKKKLLKLSHVLEKFKNSSEKKEQNIKNEIYSLPTMKLLPREVFYSNYKVVDKNQAQGKIIAENITPYPPCVPMLVAGEIIESHHIKYLPEKVKVIEAN